MNIFSHDSLHMESSKHTNDSAPGSIGRPCGIRWRHTAVWMLLCLLRVALDTHVLSKTTRGVSGCRSTSPWKRLQPRWSPNVLPRAPRGGGCFHRSVRRGLRRIPHCTSSTENPLVNSLKSRECGFCPGTKCPGGLVSDGQSQCVLLVVRFWTVLTLF